MKQPQSPQQKAALHKFRASLLLSILVGMAAAASELFGRSVQLSLLALVFGCVVGAVTYLFFLCLMILLGFILRGRFGQTASNVLCWLMLGAAPIVTWFLTAQVSSRF